MHDRTSSGRFPKDGHSVRITAKGQDVLLDPLQGQLLIEQSRIGRAIGLQSRSAQPAKRTELGAPERQRSARRRVGLGLSDGATYAVV